LAPSTTKGDLIGHNGTINVRIPVGTNSQVLTADSSQASGLLWTNSAVADNSITEFKLTTSVAGNGLTGGNGVPLAVVVDGTTIEINADTLRTNTVIARYNSNGVGQTFGVGTFLNMPGLQIDTDSAVTSTSPFIFTVPVTGYYEVYAQLDFVDDSWNNGTSSFALTIEKNAPTVGTGTTQAIRWGALLSSSGPTQRYWVAVQSLDLYSASDTIKIGGLPSTSFNPSTTGLTQRCFIYIHKVN